MFINPNILPPLSTGRLLLPTGEGVLVARAEVVGFEVGERVLTGIGVSVGCVMLFDGRFFPEV